MAELGGAGRADQPSHRCRLEIVLDGVWSLACNSRVDEVIHLDEEIVVWGTLDVVRLDAM